MPPPDHYFRAPETLQALWDELRAHDWLYEYSDDMRVYDWGRSEQRRLRAAAEALGPEGVAMFDAFRKAVVDRDGTMPARPKDG